MDLASFQAGLKEFGDKIPVALVKLQAELLERVVTDVTLGTPDDTDPTPIKTGNARANWWPSVGSPSAAYEELGIVERVGPKTARQRSGFSDFVLAGGPAAAQSIERVQSTLGELYPYATAYVTNNTPYIGKLEYESWSKQAPSGFARLAVDAIISAYKK